MTQPLCACGRPAPGATLCPICAHLLDESIAQVAEHHGLAWDLDVAISGQASISRPSRLPLAVARPADEQPDIERLRAPLTLRPQPAPGDPRASAAAATLRQALQTWAAVVAEGTGITAPSNVRTPGPTCPRCRHESCRSIPAIPQPPAALAGLAVWLRPRVGWLRHHPRAQEAFEEITAAVRQARRVVDRPAGLLYAGPCDGQDCGEHLYARPGALIAQCRGCGLIYEADARRQWLLDSLDDYLATATQLSRLVTYLGITLAPSSIRSYASKKRILPRGGDPDGHPLYRLGDVVRTYYSPHPRAGPGSSTGAAPPA